MAMVSYHSNTNENYAWSYILGLSSYSICNSGAFGGGMASPRLWDHQNCFPLCNHMVAWQTNGWLSFDTILNTPLIYYSIFDKILNTPLIYYSKVLQFVTYKVTQYS